MLGFRRDAQGAAVIGSARVADLLRQQELQTPVYFYDLDAIQDLGRRVEKAFGQVPHLIAYAVKANAGGPILRTLFEQGLGADVVSGGELELVLRAGLPPERIVMSGVAKTDAELDLAISQGIYSIQAESREEIERILVRARTLGRTARIALRVKPGIAIDSHSHIATGHDSAKFGLPALDIQAAFQEIDKVPEHLNPVGLSTHIGSMQTHPDAYRVSAEKLVGLAKARAISGSPLEYLNFGGGFGIDYGGQEVAAPEAFIGTALDVLREASLEPHRVLVEPGRALVGPFGILVARVVQSKVTKDRRWLLLDAGMNDLIRPALYGARHRVEPVDRAPEGGEWRVVGPVCESSDDFGFHPIGERVPEFVVIRDAGAYGSVMASEYNGRPLPSQVFVSGGCIQSVMRSPGIEGWITRQLGN
jgi:diaminopimelate decarboxylase